MEERRYERKNLLYYLQVKDTKTGKAVGRAVDISRGGIRLCSTDPISRAIEFNFTVDLPKSWYNDKPLEFKAKSLWCRKDVNPDLYVSGFTFEDISLTGMAKIDRLMSAASFPTSFEANEGVEHRSAETEAVINSIESHVERAEKIINARMNPMETKVETKPKAKTTKTTKTGKTAKTAKSTKTTKKMKK
ncbi:MAG: PilZ domain-containing protein [Candidatus Zixiibacteriota bacterium]